MGKMWILWNLYNWNQPLVKRSPFQHHTKELRETPSVVRDPQLDKLAHFISLDVNSAHCSLLKADTVPHSMRNPPHTHLTRRAHSWSETHATHRNTHTSSSELVSTRIIRSSLPHCVMSLPHSPSFLHFYFSWRQYIAHTMSHSSDPKTHTWTKVKTTKEVLSLKALITCSHRAILKRWCGWAPCQRWPETCVQS